MKILHTSDWHLGRSFKAEPLIEDHKAILKQVYQAIHNHTPDVLIIAGDIFDRTFPPASAIEIFNNFINDVYHNTKTAIIYIAGNHDSGDRIGLNETLLDPTRILIRGPVSAEERVLILKDKHGPVAFSAVPFAETLSARAYFNDETITLPADVLAAQIAAARKSIPDGARWVVVAHAFVSGGQISESERTLSVGGIETVPASIFEGASYVALGHLHRPQKVGVDHIRYSGAPLAFGFDEVGSEKSMTLVDLGPDHVQNIKLIPFKPHRAVREVRGRLADLVQVAEANPSNDFVKVILTDKGRLIDPMAQIRKGYPNALIIERELSSLPSTNKLGRSQASLNQPADVISEFLEFVRGETPNDSETALINTTLNALATEET